MVMATENAPRKTTFGTRLLRAIQEAGGPTEQENAARWLLEEHGIEISGPMINRYKNEDAKPRMIKATRYAEALGVRLEWLYHGYLPMRPMSPLTEDEEELLHAIREVPEDRRPRVIREVLGYVKVQLGRPSPRPVHVRSALAASAGSKGKKRRR